MTPALKRVLVLSAVVLAGCGHLETHSAVLRAPGPPNAGRIDVYLADQPPPTRAYYDVAIVQAVGFGRDANPQDVTRALTEKAASLGCDAVVRTFLDIGYTRAHAAGVCVKYTGPAPVGEAPHETELPAAPPKHPKPPPVYQEPVPRIEPLPSSPNQGR